MKLSKKTALWFTAAALALLLMSFTCAASENYGTPIDLYINSNPVDGARLINGTAYIPYRAMILAADSDATFEWDMTRDTSVATTLGMRIEAPDAEHYIEANGRILYSELAKNLNLDGTLYVPIRALSRALSLNCDWNAAESAVYLTGTPTAIESGDAFYDSDIVYWLSRIISAESRGEPFLGQIAVGNVIMNRTEDGSFPDTVYGVIFDRKYGTQFTPAATGSIYNDPTDSAVRAAKVVLEGVEVVDNALYFCADRVSKGSWMDKNREYIETIGNHVFYY